MAFQTPLTLPTSAVTNDLLPRVSNALSTPWRTFKRASGDAVRTVSQRRAASSQATRGEASSKKESHLVTLPECLDQSSVGSLRSEFEHLQLLPPSPRATMMRSPTTINPARSGASISSSPRTLWTTLGRGLKATANPSSARSYSTQPILQLNRRQALSKVNGLSSRSQQQQQHRYIFAGASQTLLANRERTANNNPSSASAQNAFYTALLRANMPAIVVERYESGRFANNDYSDTMYSKAMQQMGGDAKAGQAQGSNVQSNPENLQAVGQAIAGTQGAQAGQTGVSVRPGTPNSKDPRLYVVMEESRGASILRWVKLFLYFGFSAYIAITFLNVMMETTGALKTVQKSKNSEAQRQKARFKDVHGCDEAKGELQELVEFLQNPERFNSLGGKLPKGVLLVGPPGTGKTLLARAVAGEAGVPFFYMSGSEFDEVYVGVGAKRVRELFTQARSKGPAIIFIDELDAVGSKRSERDNAYAKQTLNQLLTELDGFSQTTGIIVIAATNFPKSLDKALTRPGRFDRKVEVPLPDVRGRVSILTHHLKNVPIGTDVDVPIIARGTPGFSGADLENLVNQAAVRASRNKLSKVGPRDFDWARDKIMMGSENRSLVVRDEDKMLTAYHEAGHALVAHFSQSAMPLHKITIVPRGISLGTTHFLPEMDMVSKDYSQYLTTIDVSMGGKAAEQLIFGRDKVTSGISGDIQSATNVAFAMVTQMGYSQKLGNVDLGSNYQTLSSETRQEIEAEVRRIVNEASDRATAILKERRQELELLTKALIEYETLTKEEMEKVLKGEKLEKLEALPKAQVMLPDALVAAGIKQTPTEAAQRSDKSAEQ